MILLEGAPRVLLAYPEALSDSARTQLERTGVEVRTGAMVTAVDAEGVTAGGERIPARTVLWAAGVQASPLARSLGAPLDRSGRVAVTAELTVPGRPEIYVIGDLASVPGVPGVAPAAIQMGRHAGMNIARAVTGEPLRPFVYKDKGLLATIGRGKAVALLGKLQVKGLVAWLLWLAVHIFFLIGFRNRVWVLFGWAWAFLTWQRGARLITEAPRSPRS